MPTHATLRLEDNALLCPTPELRRAITRSIARIGAAGHLVAWAIPDNHAHLAIHGERDEASALAWRLELAFQAYRPTGAGPFLKRWLRSDTDFNYLRNTTSYILRQAEHHGTTSDPFAEADCRLDILGLRCVVPWVRPRVRELLPRLRDERVAELLGRSLQDFRGWAHPLTVDDGLQALREATVAAFALRKIDELSNIGVTARTAAVLACPGVKSGLLARELRIGRRAVLAIRRGEHRAARALLHDPFGHPFVRAVAAQARWRVESALPAGSALG